MAVVTLGPARGAPIDRALLLRSARVAGVVGTTLLILNQGDRLLDPTFSWASSWHKVPLNYLIPFCVATYGALANRPRRAEDRRREDHRRATRPRRSELESSSRFLDPFSAP